MAQRRERGWKYDFSTRILARAEKFINGFLQRRSLSPSCPDYEDYLLLCTNFISELILLRLMEQSWLLDEGWLASWIKKQDLIGLFGELERFNEILGIEIFLPKQDKKLELKTEELGEFISKLYSTSFFPKGIPVEILGALLEKLELAQKSLGSFFTPTWLVKLMVDESFRLAGWEGIRIEDLEFAVLDPAFGSGNFLLGVLRKLISIEENWYASRPSGLFYPLVRLPDLSRSIEVELRIKLAKEHLFGLELSRVARLTAFRSLVVELCRGKKLEDLETASLSFLNKNLALGDFLIEERVLTQPDLFGQVRSEILPFSFSDKNFPHHYWLEGGGFDLIIGNPPWISLKGKHAQSPYPPEVVQWLIERYKADSYRPNLFELFVRRALELVKENGINCFIVPDRLAENLQFQSLREEMVDKGEIIRLHFREPFPGVVSDTLIYWFRKKTKPSQRKILITDAKGSEKQITIKQFIKRKGLEKEVSEKQAELLEKISQQARARLGSYLTCGVGLIARKGSIHLQRRGPDEQEIIKGENIKPYQVEGHFYFAFHPRNLLGGTVRYSKLTAKERLLVRKTGTKIICALDRSGFLVEQSVYFLLAKPRRKKYPLEYFLALLNSSVLNFYYRHFLITNLRSTPQLKKFHLERLPVKRIDFKNEKEQGLFNQLIVLVKNRLEEKDPHRQKELEEKIDQLVFELYGLNEEEIELVAKDME